MYRKITFLLILLPLLFTACKDDEDKANIYPVKLWEEWELSELNFQIETDSLEVDHWATQVIDTYFKEQGLFSRVELTNKYDLWVMNADSVQIRWKYQIARDKIKFYAKELSEDGQKQEKEYLEGSWLQSPIFRFYVQHKQLHLHTDPNLFPELLEHLLRYAAETFTEEELAELLASTQVKTLSLDLVYHKYQAVKE